MDALEFVRDRLRGKAWPDYRRIAAATGVPAFTVYNIARGRTANPRWHTLAPLRAYLAQQPDPAPAPADAAP